ncbi:MAG: helix-turn-helix transcriptional regulator [Oscillospiraceae bacterium]|nr:helix-turn-helix transcriptional regulator [Oscillospiraceae bacterium]
MIQNLNQINFQYFGNILPSREKTENIRDIESRFVLNSEQRSIPVYQTVGETHMYVSSGKSVLSVSLDGENFRHFYFDKTVCIKNNIYFYLSPFKGDATVIAISAREPIPSGSRPNDSLRMDQQLQIAGIYTFFYQEREQGFIYSGEEHPMPELTYVDQGALHSVTDGQDILLKPGDIAIFGPNQWHMHYADMGVAPRYVTISFDLEGADISPLLNRKFTAPQQAITLIQQMLQEQERMDAFSTDMIIAHLTSLMLLLLRQADSPASKLRTSNAVHSENEIIRRAQQYISSHIREKLSVPIVAQKVGVSPSYLTALFHKNLQISPGEYIRRIKLQESKQMIRENSMNFTEIAQALQYSTVHHFSRQFKEKFGLTPTEYAKSVR